MPRNPIVVAHSDGPARLAEVFAATKLRALFTDRGLRESLATSWSAVKDLLPGNGVGRLELLEPLVGSLRGFRGRVVVGVGVSERTGGGLSARVALVLSGERAELETIRRALVALVVGGADGEVGLAGTKLERLVSADSSIRYTRPAYVGDKLFCIAGFGAGTLHDLDQELEGKGAQPSADTTRTWQAPLGVSASSPTFVTHLVELAIAEDRRRGRATLSPEGFGKLWSAAGLAALRSFRWTLTPDRERALSDMHMGLDPARPAGIFGIWSGVEPTLPASLALVPDGHPLWTASRLRLDRIGGLVRSVWKAAEPEVPLTCDEGIAKAKEVLKIDVEKDILERLGGEVVVLQNVTDELPDELSTGDIAKDMRRQQNVGNCFVVAVRDGPEFARAIDKAIRARGLHVNRKSSDHAGTRVYSMNVLGLAFEYAVTEEHALLAIGAEAGKDLRAVLAKIRAGGATTQPFVASAEWKREIESLSVPVHGVGYSDASALADTIAQQVQGMLALEEPDGQDLLRKMVGPFLELPGALRRARLARSYSLMGCLPGEIVWRTVY